jgi:DNA-binding transcriptional LysR family regulator
MELNQIRYFVVMAEVLHFTKAAEACHVSQPALTKAIQKLEEELGGPLFLRERSRTQLTELGQMMRVPLERALAATMEAKAQASAFGRRASSPLRIGLEYSLPAAVLSPVLSALQRSVKDIELFLHQGSQGGLCELMLDSALDVALLVETPHLPERLHRWRMFSERYVLICPPEHRFREHEKVGVSELASEVLLLNENAHCPARQFVTDLMEREGVVPQPPYFAASQEQIVELVTAALGVSVSGEHAPSIASLVCRPIASVADRRQVVLATVAGRQLGPTSSLFLKLMRARAWPQYASTSFTEDVAA